MRFWKRSIQQDDRSHRDFTRARGPSRKRRLQLENLEERALLSTYTLSESYIPFPNNPIPIVLETVNNTTTPYFNPPSPFIVKTGSGSNTVNILNTSAHIGIDVYDGGPDTVNVGNAGSVQGILAAVNIENRSSLDTINIDDAADTTARTVTLSTFTSGGTPWGSVTGLAPAAINYLYKGTSYYSGTSSVYITTGLAADTVNVQATGVLTFLSSGGGGDTVNVGNGGDVQGILGELFIENPHNYDTIYINDSDDGTARTFSLGVFESVGTPWEWVTGLTPALINFQYANTSSLSITTGDAADTVNVQGTAVPTTLSSACNDTVNVGNAGSVQGILGTLYIKNLPSFFYATNIHINDSADPTARTVTLSTFTSGGTPWGSVTGLAPAAIDYEYAGTPSVSITAGRAADTFYVLATGVTTYLSSGGGDDTINVGNSGSVQGILGTLNLWNQPRYNTINVNDSADTTARTVTLNTYSSGGANWGSITGLAPDDAAIDYKYADTSSVSITAGRAADTFYVLATGVPTTLSSRGGGDTINVGFGSVQGILGTLNIENPPSFDTININDFLDTTVRFAFLNTFTSGGTPWGSITGLAPAAINFDYADTSSPVNIQTFVIPGQYISVLWIVNPNALASATGVVVNDNNVRVN